MEYPSTSHGTKLSDSKRKQIYQGPSELQLLCGWTWRQTRCKRIDVQHPPVQFQVSSPRKYCRRFVLGTGSLFFCDFCSQPSKKGCDTSPHGRWAAWQAEKALKAGGCVAGYSMGTLGIPTQRAKRGVLFLLCTCLSAFSFQLETKRNTTILVGDRN